ncbi:GNAT family N-acetyltransferase [Paenibacillus sp.]|uniref:GNAT family N-acetyltransferase n=1 Tax=Paenibacillus sp. TaxID=58172 RepID=UPI00281176D3|nr:GNAT family N-acetyltransferase [Paenibacillus sp.]
MDVSRIDRGNVTLFLTYCRQVRDDVGDSFLSEDELSTFDPESGRPSYLLMDGGDPVGAVSVAEDDYLTESGKARFRIFRADDGRAESYAALWEAIRPSLEGAPYVFLFAKASDTAARCAFEALSFEAERIAYVLLREERPPIGEEALPEGFELRPFRYGADEAAWCEVRNAAFATLRGSEAPMAPEHVAKWQGGEDELEGGMLLLFEDEEPVGCVRAHKDEYEGMPCATIGPLALKPSRQGRGLGRTLLRAAVRNAAARGYPRALLSVNAENEQAIALYLKEGFEKKLAFVCYSRVFPEQPRNSTAFVQE